MVGCVADRGLEAGAPVVLGLAWRAVDQVEADALEAGGPGPADDLRHPVGVVGAVEGGEHVRHRRLHAERHPGEAGRAQRRQGGLVDAVRVGLGRDLGAGQDPELVADGGQQLREVAGRQQGRRTAAEEHRGRGDVGVAEHPAGEPHLCDGRGGVGRLRGAAAELGGRVGVEVAVAAAHRAERHVQVDPHRAAAEPGVRRCGERPVARDGLPLGQGGRHAAILPRAARSRRGQVSCWGTSPR